MIGVLLISVKACLNFKAYEYVHFIFKGENLKIKGVY